ncbi:hypothetical protein ACFL06_01010 [Patescibacteria group bacterium]
MKTKPNKYLIIGMVWGIISVLIELGLLRYCLPFGNTPSWCDSFLLTLFHFTIGLPTLTGMFFVGFLNIDFEIIIVILISIISATIVIFLLNFIKNLILKIKQKLLQNRF